MSISAYTGVMGSGKSYEVVAFVIVPAVAAGRRVVTNIAGIQPDAIREYVKKHYKTSDDALGSVVYVDSMAFRDRNTFPDFREDRSVNPTSGSPLLLGGDLVVVDECKLVWGHDWKHDDVITAFWRKHRHFTNPETNVSSDIVVISQATADFHKDLKSVLEFLYRAKKIKAFGKLADGSYSVAKWDGVRQTKSALVQTWTRKYKKSIYPLYNSYSQGNGPGVELATDSRQSILSHWRLVCLPFAFLFTGVAIWYVVGVFSPSKPPLPEQKAQSSKKADGSSVSGLPAAQVAPKPKLSPFSKTWRIGGYFEANKQKIVILVGQSNEVRYEDASQFHFSAGSPDFGLIDGERVTPFSGVPPFGGSGKL